MADDQREVTIPSDVNEGIRLQRQIIEELEAYGYSDRDIFAIRLSLEEALMNAIKHGNRQQIEKKVVVVYTIGDDLFRIEVEDEGPGFKPEAVPDPTLDEFIERPGGRGLLLMRHYMNRVEYTNEGRRLLLERECSIDESRAS